MRLLSLTGECIVCESTVYLVKMVLLKLAFLRFAPFSTARSNRTSLTSASCSQHSQSKLAEQLCRIHVHSPNVNLKIGISRDSFDEVSPLELGALEICVAGICGSEVRPPEVLQQCSLWWN